VKDTTNLGGRVRSTGRRVNAVAPGPTRTPGTEPMGEGLDQIATTLPLGRPASAQEIANALLVLDRNSGEHERAIALSRIHSIRGKRIAELLMRSGEPGRSEAPRSSQPAGAVRRRLARKQSCQDLARDAPECCSGLDLGTIIDVRAEYRSDDEAGAPRGDLSDLLLANCRHVIGPTRGAPAFRALRGGRQRMRDARRSTNAGLRALAVWGARRGRRTTPYSASDSKRSRAIAHEQ